MSVGVTVFYRIYPLDFTYGHNICVYTIDDYHWMVWDIMHLILKYLFIDISINFTDVLETDNANNSE